MRHRRSYRWLLAAASALLALVVVACGAKSAGPLMVLDWADYEQEVFWADFKEEHPDQEVQWTFFADDPEAFAKLQSGFYADLVHPGSSWLKVYVDAGLLEPIDTTKLDNWSGIIPSLAEAGQVDGVQYMVPWEWGYDSLLVRTDKVKEMPDSWADMWDPQYKGHVSTFDSAEANILIAATVLGYDAYNMDDAQMAAVKQKLIELKPNLLGYWTDYTEVNQQVAAGDVWLAVTWPDAWVTVSGEGVPVEYIEPKEGRLGWVYGYALTKASKNKDLALDYIDAMISVDSMTEMANQYAYGAANQAVLNNVNPEYIQAMSLDKPDVIERTQFFKPLTESQRQAWITLWDEVKAAP